jgi:hypothetical protein
LTIEFKGDITPEVQEKLEAYCEENFAGEFLIVTEEERDAVAKEHIKETLWAFNTSFIMDNLKEDIYNNMSNYELDSLESSLRKMQEELCESANAIVFAVIADLDDFVQSAVEADGYGHFLSSYNGEEEEIVIDGDYYYAYRN